ncbi:hypothetical protein Pfo_016379 [Paulownia fortunei]|nr:hypothetical protein Pfo_016379 [Paulownia fortunei]
MLTQLLIYFLHGRNPQKIQDYFDVLFHKDNPQTESIQLFLACNEAKHRWVPFNNQRIIYKVLNHISLANRGGPIDICFWQGDYYISRQLGFQKCKRFQLISKQVVWQKPAPNWYNINCDGASRGIFKDGEGKALLVFYTFLAQLFAVAQGLQFCFESGFHNVWVEIDAQVILHMINRQSFGHWKLQTLLAKI